MVEHLSTRNPELHIKQMSGLTLARPREWKQTNRWCSMGKKDAASRWWRDGKEKRSRALEERQNYVKSLLFLFLRKWWITLTPIEPLTNASARRPMPPFSFEKTDLCELLWLPEQHPSPGSWAVDAELETHTWLDISYYLLLITGLSAQLPSCLLWWFSHGTG